MKIKIDGYEICISARSTVVEDDPFTDDRPAEVINFVICNLNTLSDFCKASTDEVYKQFAKVVKVIVTNCMSSLTKEVIMKNTEKTRVMLELAKEVRSRYVNLLELIRYMQIDTIPAQFSENDLKKILLILNDYQAILQDYLK